MGADQTPGTRLRRAVEEERPLQVVGAINAYCALLAERAGFRALYLSGAGVANASFGLPDLAMTTLTEVCEDVRRVSARSTLPLLVDADTGWGHALSIRRSVRELIRAGAAGCHLEDQVNAKRCGHRPGKELVPVEEMVDRLRAATDGRDDPSFVLMARTDAYAEEGVGGLVERAQAYVEAGADMIFAEALETLSDYGELTRAVSVPVLANITEFGRTPIFSVEDLGEVGVRLVLYPLSAFRAMSRAAETAYEAIRRDGSQQAMIDAMQTRDELYEVLGYEALERRIDALFDADIQRGESS